MGQGESYDLSQCRLRRIWAQFSFFCQIPRYSKYSTWDLIPADSEIMTAASAARFMFKYEGWWRLNEIVKNNVVDISRNKKCLEKSHGTRHHPPLRALSPR